MIRLMLLLATISGCASSSPTFSDRNNPAPGMFYDEVPGVIDDTCKDGSAFKEKCGFITTDISDQYKSYSKDFCTKMKRATCEKNFYSMVISKLELRYYAADWTNVYREMSANPVKSDKLLALERLALNSHNEILGVRHRQGRIAEREAFEAEAQRQAERMQMMNALTPAPRSNYVPIQPYQMNTQPVAPVAPARMTDFNCMNLCTSTGASYGFCQSKCSY